jgi:hypothetical protein
VENKSWIKLRGEKGHYINYRHIIDWLVRKPGAFENYRYKDDLFPTSQFRIAYDLLCSEHGTKHGNGKSSSRTL